MNFHSDALSMCVDESRRYPDPVRCRMKTRGRGCEAAGLVAVTLARDCLRLKNARVEISSMLDRLTRDGFFRNSLRAKFQSFTGFQSFKVLRKP